MKHSIFRPIVWLMHRACSKMEFSEWNNNVEGLTPQMYSPTGLGLELVKWPLIGPVRSPSLGCQGDRDGPRNIPAWGMFRVRFMGVNPSTYAQL